jgi:hypothetical protein
MNTMNESCIFCALSADDVIAENDLAIAIRDKSCRARLPPGICNLERPMPLPYSHYDQQRGPGQAAFLQIGARRTSSFNDLIDHIQLLVGSSSWIDTILNDINVRLHQANIQFFVRNFLQILSFRSLYTGQKE